MQPVDVLRHDRGDEPSSLEVYPVAGLPEETVSAGGALAIVNRGPTPFDRVASIRIEGGAGETLAALARELL